MKVIDLCEPVFSYICDIRRLSRKGIVFEHDEVRKELKNRLANASDIATKNSGLKHLFSQVELPLIFFIDYMIKESSLPFAAKWTELAYDYNELSGDEKFFDLLDDVLSDPSTSATECLHVFYTCLALGFRGCYVNDPNAIVRKLKICGLRLGYEMDKPSVNVPLCPQINDAVDESQLFNDSRRLWVKVALCGGVLLVAAFVMNYIIFALMTADLKDALNSIIEAPPTQMNQTISND